MIKPALIFIGIRKRKSKDEIAAYDDNVDVYWQRNAWAHIIFSVQRIKGTLTPEAKGLDESILCCDILTAQVTDDFMKRFRKKKDSLVYLFKRNTFLATC